MNKEAIKIDEWGRIFLGDVPPEFMMEVIIRMTFIYIILVVSLRLLGRRMESMLSRGEMVTLVTLGASVGVAIHTPERGLLPSITVILIIISLQALQAWLTSRNSNAERLLLDQISTLIEDSCLNITEMKKCRITRERLFAAIRLKGIINLGNVQRVYFESKGVFSIITFEDKQDRPGLCILPEDDYDFRSEIAYDERYQSCKDCGFTISKQNQPVHECTNCGGRHWESAVKKFS